MFWPCLALNLTSFPNLSIIFPIFFDSALNMIWITTYFNCRYLSMHVHTSYWYCRCPPFMATPMATNAWEPMMQFATFLPPLHKILASMWDENHYTHFLQPCSTPINIMFTEDGIHTLVNVVITNLTWVNLLHWSCKVQGFATFETTQEYLLIKFCRVNTRTFTLSFLSLI